MAARDGDEMVIGPVGESDDPAEQADLMCRHADPGAGRGSPADIEGVNFPADQVDARRCRPPRPHGPEAVSRGAVAAGSATGHGAVR